MRVESVSTNSYKNESVGSFEWKGRQSGIPTDALI